MREPPQEAEPSVEARAPREVSEPPRPWRRPSRLRILLIAVAAAFGALLLPVLALRFLPPPVTFLMLERLAEGKGLHKRWRPLDRIAPALPLAVIAAEDARFCEHSGFDWEAIAAARRANARGGKVRGASTISQQTAKNVFLWPHRDWLRKGLEAGYTVLIEHAWGKRRILEVYLNVVEWGPGTYGADAAARRWFNTSADRLTPQQADRLAAILPSPLKWRAAQPGRYVARRSRRIGANARVVRADDLAWCARR